MTVSPVDGGVFRAYDSARRLEETSHMTAPHPTAKPASIPDLTPVTRDEVRAAQKRIASSILRTPLVRYVGDGDTPIHLKLENLQPIGSFKIRGASNAILSASKPQLAHGVWTASAGNMAQGVAWQARRLGLACTVVAPDHAPETKLAALRRLGARIIQIPFDEWFQILATHSYAGMDGLFVHPVSNRDVMAGNGTIALEILDDLPDVDAVIAPYGGGGLSCGISAALRALRPQAKMFASEVDTAAALSAAFAAGHSTRIEYRPSFVDGMGSPFVLPEMWPLAKELLAGSIVVGLADIAASIRTLVERHRVVAEGAGASSLAAALTGKAGSGPIACVISGGNLDNTKLTTILAGAVP
jgi:threonine dehydratase